MNNLSSTYLLDGNVFDEMLINGELKRLVFKFSGLGQIKLICTYIENDEVDAMPSTKAEKWAEINILRSELNAQEVQASGLILDKSKIGKSKFISNLDMENVVRSINGNSKYVNDSVIAQTAKENNAILVTNDIELLKKANHVIGSIAIDCHAFGLTLRNLER